MFSRAKVIQRPFLRKISNAEDSILNQNITSIDSIDENLNGFHSFANLDDYTGVLPVDEGCLSQEQSVLALVKRNKHRK